MKISITAQLYICFFYNKMLALLIMAWKPIATIYTVLIILVSLNIKAQSIYEKKKYVAQRIENAQQPKIDGILDDTVWERTSWTGDFTESRPAAGTKPTVATRFKILYDDNHLYVALQCFDSAPDSIVRRLSRRDGFQGDRINVILDSNNDKRTAFIFTVTAAGVKGDETLTENGKNIDATWNPIWYADASIDKDGWNGEMKIPLSQLRFGGEGDQVWGLNVSRAFFRTSERYAWNAVRPDAPGFVSEAGELHGLTGIKPQRQLEIQPFVVAKADLYPKVDGNPYRDGRDVGFNAGLDAKIGVTNNLTLDLTFNPDFGQVEADPGAISLDGFQIFYNEQRPFFIENKDIFNFQFASDNDNLFYSRRIGRSPQGRLETYDNETYVDRPQLTTILGAAKFSGKTNDGWSIGVLESITDREYARINNQVTETKKAVEPMTNYFVGRIQKDFNKKNTFVGGILTSTHRFKPDQKFSSLADDAITGGIDFKHQWKDRAYYLLGNIVTSQVSGETEAISLIQNDLARLYQRVDATHLDYDGSRTRISGTGGKFEIGKAGSGNWLYHSGINWRSPGLELNDIGFLRKADEVDQYNKAEYKILQPTKYFREFKVSLKTSTRMDYGGKLNRFSIDNDNDITWLNNWTTSIGGGFKPILYRTALLRGGPRFRHSREGYTFLYFASDNSKPFWARAGYVYGTSRQQNIRFQKYEATLNYQPFTALSLSFNTTFRDNPNKTHYIRTVGDKYILGEIDNKQVNISLRINYSINPDLSIQYYASPFYARGLFSNFGLVNDPYAEDLNKRVDWFDSDQISMENNAYALDFDKDGVVDYTLQNPDFNFTQFRSNLVLRWEYIPGSEFFLVYAQGQSLVGEGNKPILEDIGNTIFDESLNHTFLVKYTYRFRR